MIDKQYVKHNEWGLVQSNSFDKAFNSKSCFVECRQTCGRFLKGRSVAAWELGCQAFPIWCGMLFQQVLVSKAWLALVVDYITIIYRGWGGFKRKVTEHHLSCEQPALLPRQHLTQEVLPWRSCRRQRQGLDQTRQLCSKEVRYCHKGEEQRQTGWHPLHAGVHPYWLALQLVCLTSK